jgi:hypothetical protein
MDTGFAPIFRHASFRFMFIATDFYRENGRKNLRARLFCMWFHQVGGVDFSESFDLMVNEMDLASCIL